MKTITTLFILLLISCGGAKKQMENENNNKIESAKDKQDLAVFETLVVAQIGGFTTPQIRVIKEEQALREVYGQINKTRKPGFILPKVDFKKETVVAIFMGEKNTGGYAVNVTSVTHKSNTILVTVKETQPKANAMVITALTQPFCVIKINTETKNIIFEKK